MRALALTILVVAVTTALLVWVCFRMMRRAEKMERDPKLRRRHFFFLGFLYVVGCLFVIFEVVTRDEPPVILLGLPIAAALAWFWIEQASNVKIPPN